MAGRGPSKLRVNKPHPYKLRGGRFGGGQGKQIGLELVESAGKAVVEGIEHGFEEVEFFGGGVEGFAHQG